MPKTDREQWPKRRPNRKETLEDLTPLMRTALVECFERGVPPYEFGEGEKARWPEATCRALVNNGLIHRVKNRKGRDLWRPTEDGRGVVMAHVPRFLMPAGRPRRIGSEASDADLGYTTVRAFAMPGEPEAA
jgi:hypothetical protein